MQLYVFGLRKQSDGVADNRQFLAIYGHLIEQNVLIGSICPYHLWIKPTVRWGQSNVVFAELLRAAAGHLD